MTDNLPQTQNNNPFSGQALATTNQGGGGAMVEVESQRAVSETQASMAIAKRFPRNQIEAMDRILQACTRPSLAESSLYSYSKGGTDITGPSIRLAEAIAQNWGNLQFGIRELEQRDGASTVEASAWDMETNTKQVKIFQVKHFRHTKSGGYPLKDPRDIYELTANQGARRLRACILGIIPGDVIEAAVKQCEATLATKFEVTDERIKSLLEKFGAYQVTQEMIEKRIQRRVDAITPALMASLGKIFNSLTDGMSKPADWFEVPDGTAKSINDDVKGAAKTEPAKTEAKSEPEGNPVIDAMTVDQLKAEIALLTEDDQMAALQAANFPNMPTGKASLHKVLMAHVNAGK